MLAKEPLHVPWAALYLIDEENGRAWMAASVGVFDSRLLQPAFAVSSHETPANLDLALSANGDTKINAEAAFAHVTGTRQPLALTLEPVGVGGCAAGDAPPVHATRVVISPIGTGEHVTSVVVAGLASQATPDDARAFLDLVAGHLTPVIPDVPEFPGIGQGHGWSNSERARAEGALRDSEERLRLVVESAKDYAIFTISLDGLIQSWNVGAERMFGWLETEALGQHARMIFTPDDRARGAAEEEMRQAAECGRAADERWHLKRNGDRFYASGVLVPLRPDGILTGYAKIARDLTERKQLEDALLRAQEDLEWRVRDRTAELARTNRELAAEVQERRAAEAQVKALFRRLVTVQEEERRRIARDLHDQLGQPMTVLRMELDALESRSADPLSFTAQAARIRGIAEELDRNIDFLTWDLRPAALDHLGLAAALAKLVNGWSERFGVAAEFGAAWPEGCRLSPETEANLYRLTQEALHNIAKHAAARHVSVLLERRADQAVLIIEDDGCGFVVDNVSTEPARGGLGLVSMRERATLVSGEFHIESAPGQGTSIYVRIPMPRAECEA
jgi:PAS domain S-box-containing protein